MRDDLADDGARRAAVRALELEGLGTDEDEDALPAGQVVRID